MRRKVKDFLGVVEGRSKDMSVTGCFRECAVGEGEELPQHHQQNTTRGLTVVFHPPIQTVFREKEPNKWYTDMVNSLATVGDDPNQLNEFGEAPLCMAAYRAQGLIVEELLQRDNVNVNIKGKHGRTPLYLAAEEGHVYIVKLLLLHQNIDVNCRNSPRGATALMAASRRGHSRIVELLLQHPTIIPDLTDGDGTNALDHARTSSVKWKLHNHSTRSRSLENVIPRRGRNLCHSCSSSSSSSSLDSVGETKKRIPGRQLSLESADVSLNSARLSPPGGIPTPGRGVGQGSSRAGQLGYSSLHTDNCHHSASVDTQSTDVICDDREEDVVRPVDTARGGPRRVSVPQPWTRGKDESSFSPGVSGGKGGAPALSGLPAPPRERANSASSAVQAQGGANSSPRAKFFRSFEPPSFLKTGNNTSRNSLHNSPESSSPGRSPLSALARARSIFLFSEVTTPTLEKPTPAPVLQQGSKSKEVLIGN